MNNRGVCLVCEKPILLSPSIFALLNRVGLVCENCKKQMEVLEKEVVFAGVSVTLLYGYNAFIRELFYEFKSLNNSDLASVFIHDYAKNLSKRFDGYTIICPPSTKENVKQRGFNHMELIVENISLPYKVIFEKGGGVKNAMSSKKKRFENASSIRLITNMLPKKILLVDDIFTTGSTIKACLELLQSSEVVDIHVLIIANASQEWEFMSKKNERFSLLFD